LYTFQKKSGISPPPQLKFSSFLFKFVSNIDNKGTGSVLTEASRPSQISLNFLSKLEPELKGKQLSLPAWRKSMVDQSVVPWGKSLCMKKSKSLI